MTGAAPPGGRAKWKVLGDLAASAMAVVARLATGVVLYVLMARLLGPAQFGDFMFAMAIAAFIAFAGSMGLPQQVMREVPACRGDVAGLLQDLGRTKWTLVVVMAVPAIALAALGRGTWQVMGLLGLALLVESWTDYLFALMKASGHYGVEAGVVSLTSVVHIALVGGVCWWTLDAVWTALAFLVSKLIQVGVSSRACAPHITPPDRTVSFARAASVLKAGRAYAQDGVLALVTTHLDTVLVRLTLGAYAAGVYQAGMRVVQGLLNFSTVAGNVFVPRLARALREPVEYGKVRRQSSGTFAALAVVLALSVLVGGPLLSTWGYGAAYADLQALWPWLAALMLARLLAAGVGVRLTAQGAQQYRFRVNFAVQAGLAVALVLVGFLQWGTVSVIAALILATVIVGAVYWLRLRRLEVTA